MQNVKSLLSVLAVAGAVCASSAARGASVYSNGFETNTTDWSADAVRVASGTNGVTSADGNFHAITNPNTSPYSYWGGSNFGAGNVPTAFQEYTTSLDIFLNVGGPWANDTRFDFDSAISSASGGFLRDFIFNAGFYNDATGPGAGLNRFVISASNNSQPGSAYAKNPGWSPIAITQTGWYTFEHRFYDAGGVLAVDMSILDASSNLVNKWTLSNPADLIALVGGNRYGWIDYNQFGQLAFDNAELRTAAVGAGPATPLPAAAWAGFSLLGALGITSKVRSRVRRKA